MRCEVDVMEAFVFQTKLTATDRRAVAVKADSEPSTMRVHRVPTGVPPSQQCCCRALLAFHVQEAASP
jgi:hypothetical protein